MKDQIEQVLLTQVGKHEVRRKQCRVPVQFLPKVKITVHTIQPNDIDLKQ